MCIEKCLCVNVCTIQTMFHIPKKVFDQTLPILFNIKATNEYTDKGIAHTQHTEVPTSELLAHVLQLFREEGVAQ